MLKTFFSYSAVLQYSENFGNRYPGRVIHDCELGNDRYLIKVLDNLKIMKNLAPGGEIGQRDAVMRLETSLFHPSIDRA
jgi:hypothetical protein